MIIKKLSHYIKENKNKNYFQIIDYTNLNTLTTDDIKKLCVGDHVYEMAFGHRLNCEVVNKPEVCGELDGNKQLSWVMKNLDTGVNGNYLVTENCMHYGPELYRR